MQRMKRSLSFKIFFQLISPNLVKIQHLGVEGVTGAMKLENMLNKQEPRDENLFT